MDRPRQPPDASWGRGRTLTSSTAGEVAEHLGDAVVLVVDDEGATTLAVTKLTLTSRQLARVGNLHDVGVRFGVLGEGNSLLSLLGILGLAIDDEGTSISSMR